MLFQHFVEVWARFPTLAAISTTATDIHRDLDVARMSEPFLQTARARLATVASESELPEIQAWRRAFSQMGLKPTQYRCAAEALLRRFRKDDTLPQVHPLVDLCNAISIAYAIPIAVFDLDHVDGDLTVRPATGQETYQAFSGETEQPAVDEIVFVDDQQHAHARRWTNRQAVTSAIRPDTTRVLIVAEALHETAAADTTSLGKDLHAALTSIRLRTANIAHLSEREPSTHT